MTKVAASCGWEENGTGVPLSLIAFGEPSDPRTFSGYACSLAKALREAGLLRAEYSCKDVRLLDVLNGALLLRWRGNQPSPRISRAWMWSRRGAQALSRRLERRLSLAEAQGPFLQVGTLVQVPKRFGPHYVLTDMTIPQARRAGFFEVASLSPRRLRNAVEVQRGVLEQASGVFTLSEWTRASVIEDFGVPEDRVHVVYAGSNLTVAAEVDEPRRAAEILFVGIDWERKGGPLLLEAFSLLRRRVPDARLCIVGCSPAVRDANVIVEGFLDRRRPAEFERLRRCYLRASCFCLPSLFDPFPNAIIEAASVGLPSVAIDNGSRREAVLDGLTGKLAAEATPEALADALNWVLSDRERTQTLGDAAQAHAQRNFTWKAVIDRISSAVGKDIE